MKKFAYSFPIFKDKVDQWLNFAREVNTTHKEEFSKMHQRIGVKKESWFLQESAEGYSVVVYTEAEDEHFMNKFKNDQSEFSEWFREQVSELQGVDLDFTTQMPEIVLDWEENDQ
ncbi:MAG: hypothetical protein ACQEWD_03335 [Bacteroidota bacterium]